MSSGGSALAPGWRRGPPGPAQPFSVPPAPLRECNRRQQVVAVLNRLYAAAFLRLYRLWKGQRRTLADCHRLLKGSWPPGDAPPPSPLLGEPSRSPGGHRGAPAVTGCLWLGSTPRLWRAWGWCWARPGAAEEFSHSPTPSQPRPRPHRDTAGVNLPPPPPPGPHPRPSRPPRAGSGHQEEAEAAAGVAGAPRGAEPPGRRPRAGLHGALRPAGGAGGGRAARLKGRGGAWDGEGVTLPSPPAQDPGGGRCLREDLRGGSGWVSPQPPPKKRRLSPSSSRPSTRRGLLGQAMEGWSSPPGWGALAQPSGSTFSPWIGENTPKSPDLEVKGGVGGG